jgi:hypothetical protein
LINFCIFASSKITGEVSEWLKEHAWKVCIPQKGIAGSNPALSASLKIPLLAGFLFPVTGKKLAFKLAMEIKNDNLWYG